MSNQEEKRITVGEHDECYHDSIREAITDHDGYLAGSVEPFTVLTVEQTGWLVVTNDSGEYRVFDTKAEAEAFAAALPRDEE